MHRYYLALRALLLRLCPYPRRKHGFGLYDVDPDTPTEGPVSKPGGDLLYDIRTESGWIAVKRPPRATRNDGATITRPRPARC